LFRLAREIGKTVGELERELSPEEFVEWVAVLTMESQELRERDMADRAQSGMRSRLANAKGR
jgi:desulfoferrodoxin (superoxide reductase-like protein)